MSMLSLDHVAVLGETLRDATAHIEEGLGIAMGPGGQHARFGTHNRLIGMAPDLYLEAIAIDPEAPAPDGARWFGLDAFSGAPRLDKWVLRCDDIGAALRAMPMAGRPVSLERGALSWTMAVPEDGLLPFDGMFPAILQWHSAPTPAATLPQAGLTLQELVVRHPDAAALRDLLAPLLDPASPVRFETAAAPGLAADILTPAGARWLG